MFLTIAPLQWWLSSAGNLNGISVPVLTARYAPWLSAILLIVYWALQVIYLFLFQVFFNF